MLKALRLLGVTIVLSLLLITSVACKAEYSLHVIVASGQGAVTPTSGTYTDGTSVTIAAIPDSGWEFDRWEGDISGDENPTTIRISRDKIIQAYFVSESTSTTTPTPTPTAIPTTYLLTTVIEGQGSVSPSSGTYASGSSATLTALPASGWEFDHWGNQASGTQNPITITMNSDKAVYAYFTAPTPTPGTEAVYQGLATAQATMRVTSSVYANGNAGLTSVDNVSFQLSTVLQNQNVDLGKCVVNYQDSRTVAMNISCGSFTGLLKPNEVVLIRVNLSAYNLGVYDTFTIEIIPPTGASLQIRRTLPGAIEAIMNLY